jgi:hypothetical protein
LVVASLPDPVSEHPAVRWGVALLVLLAAGLARAGGLRVQDAGLPFTEAELREAVALRLSGAPAGDSVVVSAGEAGRVRLERGDRRDEVWIGARRSEDAARLVALLVVDALRTAPPVPAVSPARWSVFLAPAVNAGLSDAGASFEPTAGVGLRLSARTRLLLSAGYGRAQARGASGVPRLTLDTVPVRLGAGVRLGPIEAQGGALARGHRASGAITRLGVRAGGWAALLWRVPVRGALWPYLALGCDLHLERLELRLGGRPALASGNLAPWAAAGVAWGP